MTGNITRRALVSAGVALALGSAWPAKAQARKKLRFSSAFTEQDLRADA
jgi:TRAP-type transport system periplasmic protein